MPIWIIHRGFFMPISTMIIIIDTLLIAGGVAGPVFKRNGANERNAIFLLLCTSAMNCFIIETVEGVIIDPACMLVAAWLFGAAFAGKSALWKMTAVIPAAMLTGLAAELIPPVPNDAAPYAIGALCIPTAVLLGENAGAAAAALIPIFAEIFKFAEYSRGSGYYIPEFGESVLAAQLIGMTACYLYGIIKQRILSYVRTNRNGRTYEKPV